MTGRYLVVFAALAAVLPIGACAHVATNGSAAPAAEHSLAEYLPLAVGNRWTYQTSFQGQPQADLVVEIVKRRGDVFIDNRPRPSHLTIDGQGIRDGNRRYLLKAPLATGTRWMSVADVRTVEHYRILEVGRKVTVPAGNFDDCVVVRMEVRLNEKRAVQNDMTFAPGVGIVRIATRLLDGSREIPQADMRLKDVKLAASGR